MQQAIQSLYNQATELYGQAKAILDAHPAGDMPQEKQNELDRLFDAFDAKNAEAKRLERAASIGAQASAFDTPINNLDAPAGAKTQPGTEASAFEMKALERAFKGGTRVLTQPELKALRADSDPSGGLLVAPQQFVTQLIQAIDDMVIIRSLGTVYRLERAESLGVPVLDTDLSAPDWTSELLTGSDDTVEPFAKRELKPSPLAKRIKLSRKLLRQSTVNAEALVRERLAYKFGTAAEQAYLTGHGVNQPLGVFTPSTVGVSTSRDVTAASASALAGDDFINLKFKLKGAYWPKARLLLHRDMIKAVRKLKDGNNNYIWSPGLGPGGGLAGGLPSTIADMPFELSEFAPSTLSTGQYVAVYGDFSYYWIADALNLEIQVINELYAESNQIGYIGRLETDGMPVHEEAFARLIMA